VAVDADLVVESLLDSDRGMFGSNKLFNLLRQAAFSPCRVINRCSTCWSCLPDASGDHSIVTLGQVQPPYTDDEGYGQLPDQSPRKCRNLPMAHPNLKIDETA
jgi:hypothetical protein